VSIGKTVSLSCSQIISHQSPLELLFLSLAQHLPFAVIACLEAAEADLFYGLVLDIFLLVPRNFLLCWTLVVLDSFSVVAAVLEFIKRCYYFIAKNIIKIIGNRLLLYN
jgi:hypothetical protein